MRHLQRAMVYLRSRGMDGESLFLKAGLNPAQLADGEAKVPLSVVEALLAAFQQRYADPFIGLRMAEDIQPSTLGALGFLLQSCSTLSDLLDIVVRFNGMLSSIGTSSMHHAPGEVEIRWRCSAGSPALRRQLHEYIKGSAVVIGRLLLQGAPDACLRVGFEHPAPEDPRQLRIYRTFFCAPVVFDQAHTFIAMPARMLQATLPHGDATLRALLEAHARKVFESRAAPLSWRDEVGRLLHDLVLSGNFTREELARRLGVSARSLHRRLEEEGTSYREQLDEVRLKMARGQLANSDIASAELSEQLGFSTPQAFMRWFRQRCEVTPGQFRLQARGGRMTEEGPA